MRLFTAADLKQLMVECANMQSRNYSVTTDGDGVCVIEATINLHYLASRINALIGPPREPPPSSDDVGPVTKADLPDSILPLPSPLLPGLRAAYDEVFGKVGSNDACVVIARRIKELENEGMDLLPGLRAAYDLIRDLSDSRVQSWATLNVYIADAVSELEQRKAALAKETKKS